MRTLLGAILLALSSPAAAAKEGIDLVRLERLRTFVEQEIASERMAGAVMLVAHRGRVVYQEAVGMADREEGRTLDRDAIFRIRSMTKPIVSLAVLLLHEEGRFLLDDPVAKFLPELANPRVAAPHGGSEPAERPITIKDLLTHRAGLTYAFINRGPVGELYRSANLGEVETARDLVRKLAELPLVHQPGTTFEYSHATDVLGVLVEVVSGKSLDLFLRERILEPLGMKDTDFYLPEEKAERLVTLYRREEGKALQPVETGRESRVVRGPKTLFAGGGGLVSTAGDYSRFLQLLLNGGELDGVRIVSPKTVELMTADHVGREIPVHPGYGFGLGFAVRQEIGRGNTLGSRGEYNWGGIDNTEFFVDPEESLLVVFCTNVSPYDMHRKWYLKTLVYQALVE